LRAGDEAVEAHASGAGTVKSCSEDRVKLRTI